MIYRQGIKPALARERGSQLKLKVSVGIPRCGQRSPEIKEFQSLPTVKEGKKKNQCGYNVLNFILSRSPLHKTLLSGPGYNMI